MTESIVSILIPVFNREDYIAACIASAQTQTLNEIEIIVVDNASTDRTYEICSEIAKHDSRIRLYQNKRNIGPVRNWLACLDQAKSPYVKILWSDDLILPSYLEQLLPYLDNPNVGFVYSSAKTFKDDPDDVAGELFSSLDTGIFESQQFINGILFGGDYPYSPGCAIFRIADLKSHLLLHVKNRLNSDFSMHAIGNDLLTFLLTAKKYPYFGYVRTSLALFRAHPKSITISAPRGRVPLHYNIAKGFFAESENYGEEFIKKLNSKFLIDLIRYRSEAKRIGIRSVTDFYPTIGLSACDYNFLIMKMWLFLRKNIFSL